MGVTFEADVAGKFVERHFPIMSVGWVADVVAQAGEFAQVGVSTNACSNAAGDLRDFEAVGQACSWGVAVTGTNHLGFVCQSPQRCGVEHAGTVSYERSPGVRQGAADGRTFGFFGVAALFIERAVLVVHRFTVANAVGSVCD